MYWRALPHPGVLAKEPGGTPPAIFVKADSKGVTGTIGVKADSKGVTGCRGDYSRLERLGHGER
jgi:hypothetical protein